MTRRELREHIFNEIFTGEFYFNSEEDIREQMELYFQHAGGDGLDISPDEVSEEDRTEVIGKALAIFAKRGEIDELLDRTAVRWTTGRMSRTDLAILRVGVYELLYDDLIPDGVAINEAVLLAKKFGGEESSAFVNGILGKIQRGREDAPEASAQAAEGAQEAAAQAAEDAPEASAEASEEASVQAPEETSSRDKEEV